MVNDCECIPSTIRLYEADSLKESSLSSDLHVYSPLCEPRSGANCRVSVVTSPEN